MTWTKFLIAIWCGVLGYSVIAANLPASWWFRVGQVHIENTAQGNCPVLAVDREIKRPFWGDWTAVLLRKQGSGGFSVFRVYSGATDYQPATILPEGENLNLAWWFEIPKDACAWPRGEYRVQTSWIITPDRGAPRRPVRRTSNTFTIR
jgi:hypothetical protein